MNSIKYFVSILLFIAVVSPCMSVARGQIAFEDVTSTSGFTHAGETFGLSWGDFNGDGYADLWVSNHSWKPSLYLNNLGSDAGSSTAGLLSYYAFEEGSGQIAVDSSVNGNDGAINGGVVWTTGANGSNGGLEFNGADTYVDIGDIDLTDAFTISAWIKLSSLGKRMIVGKTFQTYQFYVSSAGNLVFQRNSGTSISYAAGLTTDTWYHVAVTFDTVNGMSLYLNGSLVSTNGDGSVINQNDSVTKIGATDLTAKNFFAGVIDEVRIYNRALTSQELEGLSDTETFFSNIIDQVWSSQPDDDTHGAQWIDFDNDGDQDLSEQVGNWLNNNFPHHMFVNDSGILTDQADALNIEFNFSAGRTPLWFDYDNDGLLDAFLAARIIGTVQPTLFHQTSTGFVNVNNTTGVNITVTHNGAQLSDLNGDGILEFIPNRYTYPDIVYDITTIPFTNIGSTLGIPTTYNVDDRVLADFNNDTLIDILTVSDTEDSEVVRQSSSLVEIAFTPPSTEEHGITFRATGNTLSFKVYRQIYKDPFVFIGADGHQPSDLSQTGNDPWNRHRNTFTIDMDDPANNGIKSHVVGVNRGLYIGFNTSTQLWEMYNAPVNGDFTMEVSVESDGTISDVTRINFSQLQQQINYKLLINNGSGFDDRTAENGLTDAMFPQSVVAGDFDNDMDLDIYIVNSTRIINHSNMLYENMGDGTFLPVANSGGAAGTTLGRGDSVATADYDNDGFLDLAVVNGSEFGIFSEDGPDQLFHNIGNNNNWLEIDLEGTVTNRDGIGAIVYATAGGVMQIREQNGGMHNHAQNHMRIHFGMGSNTVVDSLEVHWPSGIVQTLTNVNVNQILRIVESEGGEGTPTPVASPVITSTPTPIITSSPVSSSTPVATSTPTPVATASPVVSPTPVTTATPIASPSPSPSPIATPDVSLLAYYAFEEGSGVVAIDSSGNGNNGTINGGATWTTGANGIGGGLDFNGVDAYVDIGDIDLTNAFTIAAWVKPSVLGRDSASMIVGKTFQTYQLYISPSNRFVFQSNSATQLGYDAGLVANAWRHVAVTFNTTDGMVLYVDGSAVVTNSTTQIIGTDNVVTKIGATELVVKKFFLGTIDEVRIYDRSLTANEVQTLLNN